MAITTTAPLTFTRPSRTGGPDHQVTVDSETLTPESCTCAAGQRGIVCWAVLDVARGRALVELARARWAQARGLDELTAAAAIVGKTLRHRAKASAELARRQQRLEAQCFGLTDLGQDMVARLRAWDWLHITPSAAPEPTAAVSLAVAA